MGSRAREAKIDNDAVDPVSVDQVVLNPPARMDSLPFRLVQMGEDQGLAPMGLNQDLGPLLLRPLPGVVEEGEGAADEEDVGLVRMERNQRARTERPRGSRAVMGRRPGPVRMETSQQSAQERM